MCMFDYMNAQTVSSLTSQLWWLQFDKGQRRPFCHVGGPGVFCLAGLCVVAAFWNSLHHLASPQQNSFFKL